MPLINATAPDARFIYEAVDAAKSLLSTFNNFVDPQTLRYMPSSYYLFIIYSAVFLYKVIYSFSTSYPSSTYRTPVLPSPNIPQARSTTTMTEEERTFVRHMITQTIERLQKASMGANHMGSRYARLLQLLWRKPPKHPSKGHNQRQSQSTIDSRLNSSNNPNDASTASQNQQQFDPSNPNNFQTMGGGAGMPMAGNNQGGQGFSWLDLGATWNFATQNGIGDHSSSASTGDLQEEVGGLGELSPFDMSLLTDYSLLEGEGSGLIF
jgi:hypothetical protein